jgi:hypothetical protein
MNSLEGIILGVLFAEKVEFDGLTSEFGPRRRRQPVELFGANFHHGRDVGSRRARANSRRFDEIDHRHRFGFAHFRF